MQGHKQLVSVLCNHGIGGKVTPLSFRLQDGENVRIDKILDVRRAASLKAGGCGMRYTVRIFAGGRNRESYLFDDGGEWFVEI